MADIKKSKDDDNKAFLDPTKLRFYRIANGQHKPKNRSSKTILRINHCNKINSYKSMSGAMLTELSKKEDFKARVEIDRRRKKAAKRGKTATV